jgi:hypothetical protein
MECQMTKRLYRSDLAHINSQTFNLDNGNGTTVDEALFNSGPKGCRIERVYALYQEAAQTVAGGNFKLGTAVGGATLVAATAYTDTAAVGDKTDATVLLGGEVAPNTTVFVRHTGVGATQTGTAKICAEVVFNR